MEPHRGVVSRLKVSRSVARAVACAFLAAIALVSGCSKQQAAPTPPQAIPVVVAKVTQKAMPVQLTAIGNVEAYSTVSIRAQVPGRTSGRPFQGGRFGQQGPIAVHH